MTAILRIVNVQIENSSSILVTFTETLTNNLIPANVSILSQNQNVPNSQALLVTVSGAMLSITCQPLTPLSAYFLQFKSVANNPFISTNGDAKISEDGVSNTVLINGPADSQNPITQYLGAFYKDNIYILDDPNTLIYKYIQSLSANLSKALYDIGQVKNENYLTFTVVDELQTRGTGPFDRLYQEAAYDIFRVGLGPTSALAPSSLIFNSFPTYPITLQRELMTEQVKTASVDFTGTFNINTLTFNLSKSPVTRVNSIVFTFNNANPVYTYNISTLGYQINNSRYDQDYASSYLLLANNQIKLNEKALQDSNFALNNIFSITVQYEYKDLGREVDVNSVNVFTTLQSIREVLPPIVNIFNLQHAPITDSNNNIPTLTGATFIDPNSNVGLPHPAFTTEILFRLSALPSVPGQYSIDYSNGTVYVYGANNTNDGTGPSPPLATYYYKFVYTSETDYVYDEDLLDIVALPLGNLINSTGTINFNYEEVLIPGTDYVADSHIESINERIGNNLIALNTLTTQNSPITNVFQIYNETSGEIYTLDRWYDNKVYFRFNNPPRILKKTGENATFLDVTNELLFVNNTITNSNNLRIFVIFLADNNVISSTQDGIASSVNTSLRFTNGSIFTTEKWYNQQANVISNTNRLFNVGEYTTDYINGIVYIAVSNTQGFNIGTATYKKDIITPKFPHVISVDDIYNRISIINPKNNTFSYLSFSDGKIIPQGLTSVDEAFLNNVTTGPYQYFNGMIGTFINAIFVPGVTSAVKFVRGVYEYNDLLNSSTPLNFAQTSVSNNFNISVSPINKQSFDSVQYNSLDGYFILLNENIPYISSNITYTFSIIRVSDSKSLWNGSGTIVAGNPLKLILPGINSPAVGDLVNVTYSFAINSLARVIIDYNKGDLFIDYTYLADELLVSYEYGDNVIDFRQNTNLPVGTQYYVSYKVGALRDALLKNFGTLVNVPDLATFDLSLDRERYRDALRAALSSFVQGPTIAAIKNIGQLISHIEPQVIESAFEAWSLGNSLLFPLSVKTNGAFQLPAAHFGNGVLVNSPNQTITLPTTSNLRLEEGSFETWVLPQWNGLDNDASLTFTITRDGYAIDPFRVFIGASEYHPNIINGVFTLNKNTNVIGKPNTNKDGIFIYYNNDISGNFQRWYFEVIDGYVTKPNNHIYKLQITSTGKFYDAKSISTVRPKNLSTFTGTNKLNVTITPHTDGYGNVDGYGIDTGLTFLSDIEHYILDLGTAKDSNRLSIFKDISGYLNFRVYDKDNTMYSISADVSSWKINDLHMIAASWKLNTRNDQDEMHLFIDGLEVPNIIRYGQKLQPYLHEKFRTVDPEEIAGLATRDIIASNDLKIISGSNIVTSSINFGTFHILVGDTIFIDEVGFVTTGYTINAINGQSLILNTAMPISISSGRFSINRTQFIVNSEINIVPNIAVTTIHSDGYGTDLITVLGSNTVTSASINFSTLGILPGYLLRINNPNFALVYTILQVSAHSLIITDTSPISLSGVSFEIYPNIENEIPGKRALYPAYTISKDSNFNNILTVSNDVFANDLILIRTLGLNHRDVKKQYYVWSDGYENILMTRMPPPISLDEASITKIILPTTAIGPTKTFITGPGPASILQTNFSPIFWISGSPDGYVYQPTGDGYGRTLQIFIKGNNTNFAVPVQVVITGTTNGGPTSETVTFTKYGIGYTIHQFITVSSVQVTVVPINALKNALTIEVREKYSMTFVDGYVNAPLPIVKYSYNITAGYTLTANGLNNFVTDSNNLFSALDIGNYLYIGSPSSVAGYYLITGLSADRHSISIQPIYSIYTVPLSSFVNGTYQVLNVNAYRSGLQNGYFTFEIKQKPGKPFLLNHGFYELEYATYARIKFDSINEDLYIGSDFQGNNQANAIIDQTTVYSVMLTDTRIGEVVANNQRTITKDFNSLKPPMPDSSTLFLLNFDAFPFSNSAGMYSNSNDDHQHFQSNWAVNDNFGQSIVVLDEPILVSNNGILDVCKQGTIEFWMSPLYDTFNDPQNRFYFDASSAIKEETVSADNVSVKVSTPINKVLSVCLAAGDSNIDYFVGGKVEIDTQRAIQEEGVSIGKGSVLVTHPILQVITVKILGDFTGIDYFAGGSINSDQKTIYLGKSLPENNLPLVITYQSTINNNKTLNTQIIRLNRKLPSQNTKVIVTYVPSGLQGDRISLFKDKFGYINFSIMASGQDFTVRAPTRWVKNTWHRVKASYKLNSGTNNDEMRLFLDGYQYSDILFGQGFVFGTFPMVMGGVNVGDGYSLIGNINFKDPINELFIGTDFTGASPIFTLLDNFRISNVSRPVYAPYGEPIDVNYSSNLSAVFPVTSDLYTTYLLDFNRLTGLNTNFTTLINRSTGAFDFTVNIIDSLGIVASSAKVKEVLENLINILKPASSRVYIKYIT